MKKISLHLFLAILGTPVWASYGGGTGAPGDPYLIYTPEHLNAIGANPVDFDKHFKVMADLDMSGYDGQDGRPAFNSIGHYISWSDYAFFNGVFDGNFKTISNLTIPYNRYMGMFKGTDFDSVVRYVVLTNVTSICQSPHAYPNESVGGLIGYCRGGIVEHCSVSGQVGGGEFAGGLIGRTLVEATITHSSSTAVVHGDEYTQTGGFVGLSDAFISHCRAEGNIINAWGGGFVALNEGHIIHCIATGNVSGDGGVVGGFCGLNAAWGRIESCYATGHVHSQGNYAQQIGGFISSNQGLIDKCFSTGNVTGDYKIGGFVGINEYETAIIRDCFSTGNVSAESHSGGFAGSNEYSGLIIRCYSAGAVAGEEYSVGGFLGTGYSGSAVTDSFYDSTKAPLSAVADLYEGTADIYARTTAQMQTQSTFTAYGWDFMNVWRMCTDGIKYPNLVSALRMIGDFVCPDGVTLADFAVLAGHWMRDDCDSGNAYCLGTDMDGSGGVDLADLVIFSGCWLEGTYY